MIIEMEIKQKNPVHEAIGNNPWYTADQLAAARGHQSRVVQRRSGFILKTIRDYLESHHRNPTRILDAGCGDGVQIEELVKIQGLEISGIDYNPIRTERVKKTFPNVNIICGDLLHIPLKMRTFDIVLCSQVIEHIPPDDFFLKELAEIIRPKGLLILGTPNEGCLMAQVRNHIFERNILKNTDHLHFYREPVIRRKIEAAGFSVREVMRENWFFPHQRINLFLANRAWGVRMMTWLSHVIPSQTAGYYFRCVKGV